MIITAMAALVCGLNSAPVAIPTQPDLHDLTFKLVIEEHNSRELKKINRDFSQSYQVDYAIVHIKDPFMLRVDSTIDGQTAVAITNGAKVKYRIPRAGINLNQDVTDQPGRRQTWLDFGLLTPSVVDEFFLPKFIRNDRATGDRVYDLTYRNVATSKDTTRYRVWIDPNRGTIDKREWYGQLGEFRATFEYVSPVKIGGIYIPTEIIVKNADGKLAGKSKILNIKVNQGISSDLF